MGECGLFAGLSTDDRPEYESVLKQSISDYELGQLDLETLVEWPSIYCGWEMLQADIASGGTHVYFPSRFTQGNSIPINGLVWMGTKQQMSEQIGQKLAEGFNCVKLKIGAIDFQEELSLLAHIRSNYSSKEIEIRLDANGAFSPDEALKKLQMLSKYGIHSMEQPIRQGQWDSMANLCEKSPISIALDEELIGVHRIEEKRRMIEHISPQFIILKPSLVGGFKGSDEWISIAEDSNIPWWGTSALESNIGLMAIAQWVASKSNPLPQGLGTGGLYTNNIQAPLRVQSGSLIYDDSIPWDIAPLMNA